MIREASHVQLCPKTIFQLLQIYTPHPFATTITTSHVNSFSNIIYMSNKTYNYVKERIPKQLLGVENSKVHTKCLHTYKQQTPREKVPPSHIWSSNTTIQKNSTFKHKIDNQHQYNSKQVEPTPLPKIVKH